MTATVAQTIVEYLRGVMVGNERQGLAGFYGYMTSHLKNHRNLIDLILTGTQSSGKTHLQRAFMRMLPEDEIAQFSSGSPKAFIYDEDLQHASYYFFSELQKFTPEWIEFLKSLSGDDPNFVYKVTVKTAFGFTTQKIVLKKTPFSVTSAREMTDPELKSRLLQIPMDENKELNAAVIQWQLGADSVVYKDTEYRKWKADEREELEENIKTLVELIKSTKDNGKTPTVEIPQIYMHSISSMIDATRTNARRHAKIIAILLKISRLVDFIAIEMNPMEEIPETLTVRAQDMLNVITLQPILLTTITEMDTRAKIIYDIVNKYEGVTRAEIHKHLTQTTTSKLGIQKIGSICQDMVEQGLLEEAVEKRTYRYRVIAGMQMFGVSAEIKELLKADKSKVTDPITGQEYKNIKVALEDMQKKHQEQLILVSEEQRKEGLDVYM